MDAAAAVGGERGGHRYSILSSPRSKRPGCRCAACSATGRDGSDDARAAGAPSAALAPLAGLLLDAERRGAGSSARLVGTRAASPIRSWYRP